LTTTLPSLWITSSTALLQTGQYLLAMDFRPSRFFTDARNIIKIRVYAVEPRPIYDVTDEGDREEAAGFLAEGVDGFALSIPEDLDLTEVEDLFRRTGAARVTVDASLWPREISVETDTARYVLRKVEEGVYRVERLT
jgi:hypothetical protein